MMKQALTIAGSDSGGGAGIQADLKSFHANGVFGTSVVTAVTAQNTVAVTETFDLPVSLVTAQLNAVLDDFDIAAAKTGMLSSAAIVSAVSATLRERGGQVVERLVVDPVMISKGGSALLKDDAVATLKKELLPLALLVTPNKHEAQLLSGMTIASADQVKNAAKAIHDYGCRNVLIKGGHTEFDPATDMLFDGKTFHAFRHRFVETSNLHGTGCTFSAAITARLALGEPLLEAVAHAKHYISRAIEQSLAIGHGHGPTHHFYFLEPGDCLER
ncbi:MAG: bifunctional hydroxymethylpyrimidine kinase/phosphomethylpyrimidine kinase [Candidatus Krumholzibacteria bacterium]